MPYPSDLKLDLSTVLGFAPIQPSEGGWDGVLNDRVDEGIIDLRQGLLARRIALNPVGTGGGSILMVVPTGFSAYVTQVHVIRKGTTPSATDSYDFGSQDTAPDNWNDGVLNFDRLDNDDKRLIIEPRVAATNQSGNSPLAVTIIDGDNTNNDFRAIRTAGTGLALDWWVFGYCWRNP